VCIPTGFPVRGRLLMIELMRSTHPGLRLEVQEHVDPLDHLHEGFDLVLHHGPPPDRSSWFSRVLHRVFLRVIASASYVAEHGRPTTLEELKDHTLLGWDRPGAAPDRWPYLARDGALVVEPALISDNTELLHAAVREGVGLLLGASDPRFHMDGEAELVTLFGDEIGDELALRVLTPSPTTASPLVRAVIDQVGQFIDSVEG
jgi:DNA-binding transcriptional LysR family regulator